MSITHNQKLSGNARVLRKRMTKEERHLWYDFLKDLPVMVHRQKVIGNYIVDFYVASCKVVIELDGSQHYENSGKQADEQRDIYLKSLGITVWRYANSDIQYNFSGVCEDIWNRLQLVKQPKASPWGEAVTEGD